MMNKNFKIYGFKIRKTKAQSMVEFSLILPIFLLFSLGLIQFSFIIINTFLVKYTAYIVGRVAVSYYYSDEKIENAKQADNIMKLILSIINSKETFSLETGKNILFNFILEKIEKSEVEIEQVDVEGSKEKFINVKVKYYMPLKVPFVNKIFGFFNKEEDVDYFKKFILVKLNNPYYLIKSNAIMRCPFNEEE